MIKKQLQSLVWPERDGLCGFGSAREEWSHTPCVCSSWGKLLALPVTGHILPASSGSLHMLFPLPQYSSFIALLGNTG